MKALAWTNKGIEKVSADEIRQLTSSDVTVNGQFILFDAEDEIEICQVCYLARSIRGAMLFLGSCKLRDITRVVTETNFPMLDKSSTFAVRLKKFDAEVDAKEIEAKIGDIIREKTKARVDLDDPKTVVLVLVDQVECFLGIDFAGVDLGKRDYKIFSTRQSLKGNLAFAMAMLAGFKRGYVLLDPFGRDGMIGIEAALFSQGVSPHFYRKEKFAFQKFIDCKKYFQEWDKAKGRNSNILIYDSLFHNVAAIKKNAKIAGIEKSIVISRIDVDWVDIKVEEGTVNCIVSYPPQLTQRNDKKTILKLYNELLHQAEFVLKRKGKMVLAVHSLDIIEKTKHLLKQEGVVKAYQGEELIYIAVFQKL